MRGSLQCILRLMLAMDPRKSYELLSDMRKVILIVLIFLKQSSDTFTKQLPKHVIRIKHFSFNSVHYNYIQTYVDSRHVLYGS